MKRLLILLLSLLIFSFSFSWEKIKQDDEFGDTTSIYMLGEKIKEGNGIVMVGRDAEENDICMFIFPNKNFIGEEVVIKMKSKNYTTEVEGFTIGKNLLFKNSEAKAIYRAFRDSSIVKFNFKGTPFSVSGIGFTKLYKEAYWKDFDLEKPSYKPPKGEKVYSLVEGEGYLEAEDAIWD